MRNGTKLRREGPKLEASERGESSLYAFPSQPLLTLSSSLTSLYAVPTIGTPGAAERTIFESLCRSFFVYKFFILLFKRLFLA